MSERRGLGRVGYIKNGYPLLLSGLKDLMRISGVDQETFDRCIEEQLNAPETFLDKSGKPCPPDIATTRYFRTPLKSPDKGLVVFVSLERNPVNPTELSNPELRTDEGVLNLQEKKPFFLQEGGSLEQFEEALGQVVNDAPFLLAELKLEMESRGFRWVGKPKQTIAAMQTVTVIQDKHPQPVDFVVRKSEANNMEYLSRNKGFMCKAQRESVADFDDEVPESDGLFQFAFVPDFRFEDLAKMALPESWTVVKDEPLGVLRSYLKYTFLKARQKPETFLMKDGSYAIFNTGLVNKNYDWIYACFVPNQKPGKLKWFLRGFCTIGDRGESGLGKWVSDMVGKTLPKKVVWLGPEELYFDVEKPIRTDWTHLIQQRIERLPKDVVLRFVDKDSTIGELYCQIEEGAAYRERYYEEICSMVNGLASSGDLSFQRYRGKQTLSKWDIERMSREAESPEELKKLLGDYLNAVKEIKDLRAEIQRIINSPECDDARFEIKKRLETAVELATQKIRWDYATAVPAYYPENNTFGFLLPLVLSGTTEVGAALVVSRTEGGAYQGQTILTPEMAYSNARLLRKPDATWISMWGNA